MNPSAHMKTNPASPPSRVRNPGAAVLDAAADWKARADAGLTATDKALLAAWLAADPRHRAAFARLGAVWSRFDGPVDAGAGERLLAELSARAGRRRRRRVRGLAAGVAAVLALGIGWQFLKPPSAAPAVVATAPAPTSAVVLRPERRVLADGSVVELRAGARLTAAFSAERRLVTLEAGEAHFDVTKDPSRPFVVTAGGVEARAVGTTFSVQHRADAIEVLVTEGIVAVNQPVVAFAPTATQLEVLLEPGRIVVVSTAAGGSAPVAVSVPAAEIDARLAWRAPRVEFTRTPLREAVAVLNGYAAGRQSVARPAVHLVIEDAALVEVQVSGLFRVDNTEAFIGLLRDGFGIEAVPRSAGVVALRVLR